MRRTENINMGWRFIKDAKSALEAEQEEGVSVCLPHTWNDKDGQDGGNDYYRGTCWYIKKLNKPKINYGEQIFLEFTGAAMIAEVYLNQKKLARHEGGYSTFRVDITEQFSGTDEDTAILAVSVDNSANNTIYPQMADFTFYGGLYRDVNLIIVPETHFSLNYAGGLGIKVTTSVSLPDEDEKEAAGSARPVGEGSNQTGNDALYADTEVTVETWIIGNAEKVEIVVGDIIKETPVENGYAKEVFHLKNAHLWNGLNDPYLYSVTAALPDDEIHVRFGCRSFAVDPQKGFILNGKDYPLRGVSRHQDRSVAGNALTAEMQLEDLKMILELGANTIRLAHYQHSQYFYDLCDEAGMILWAEIPYITMHMENGRDNTLSQMKELVVQNYHHPSVICWGLSNEITAASKVDEELLENHRQLHELCHRLDSTRLTVMANVFMLETDSPLLHIPDINSYNLYFGWYLGELEQNDSFFDEYHKTYPKRCIGLSEYGADANPAFQSADPERGDYTETYQCIYHEHMLAMIQARPWLWATHVWNMFDFAADGRDEGGAHGVNQKGLVSMDRKLKKDAFYLYKAYWSREPFVHLCGRRYRDRTEDTTEIKVYSNQQKVELFVDGTFFGSEEGSMIFRFLVPVTGEQEIMAKAGELSDSILIRKVKTANPAYVFAKEQAVENWFDRDTYDPDCYSIFDTMGEFEKNQEASAIVQQLMAKASASRGDVAEQVKDHPGLKRMMQKMTLESLLKQAGDAVPPDAVKQLNRMLQRIKK